jgi:ribonucleoside-diphosphate reductase alpha chain
MGSSVEGIPVEKIDYEGNGRYIKLDGDVGDLVSPLIEAKKIGFESSNGHKYIDKQELVGLLSRGYKGREFKYSPMVLQSYDKERHVKIEDARKLIENQNDRGLDVNEFNHAIENQEVKLYKFKGQDYVDRLDIGRVFHKEPRGKEGLSIERYFSTPGENPLESVKYSKRHIIIKESDDRGGKIIFEMNDAQFPSDWDDVSASIVSQKYFYKPAKDEWRAKLIDKIGNDHENSPAHLINRVTNYFADEGERLGYFKTEEDKQAFADELKWLQINRKFAFNSPVQFNAGIYNEYGVEGSTGINFHRNPETGEVTKIMDGCNIKPQCHACFIKGPRDDLESIAMHAVHEIGIFSSGSGIGQHIGALRADQEPLSGGGKASGPMSYLDFYDNVAGSIKSGGKSRRAARMTVMRGGAKEGHPDTMKFIRSKVKEDHKALTLMKAGYEPGMDGEAFTTVKYQNTNISVRLDDEFFDLEKSDGEVQLRRVIDGKIVDKISARRMLQEISFGGWRVGDPGMQYESMIDLMHTAKNSGRQNATNPCSEYLFLDDTSCNLASTNLLAFSDEDGNFNVEDYKRACRLISIAQDIQNDAASYPVEDIAMISPEFRTIGLGYANLGALLMRKGLAYDSDEGRAYAAGITALMTGTAYETSVEMAEKLEPFVHYEFNKNPMMEVMNIHRSNLENVLWKHVPDGIKEAAQISWDNVVDRGEKHGFRNAQSTVLAPTGTISYLMGCDTTGIEPGLSLIYLKDLAGGGTVVMENKEVPHALQNLGYGKNEIEEISMYIREKGTVVGSPNLNPNHYKVFETSFGNENGEGSMAFEGHIKMLGAVQPFISGAISKTNNLPKEATVKDIYDGYLLGHELGLKAVAVFRNDAKPVSALNFGVNDYVELKRGEKEDLPSRRNAFESEVEIDGTPFHIMTSDYLDGRPGQVTFLSYKAGSELESLYKNVGIMASSDLKRGIHLKDLITKWRGQKFQPSGMVSGHPWIKTALSPLDFASKVLDLEYFGNLEVADVFVPEDKSIEDVVNVTNLHGFNNGAFRTYDRMTVDDWDVDQVLKDPEYGGFVEDTRKLKLSSSKENGNERGVTCVKCGRIMDQTSPNCYSCRCGENRGGCNQ